MNRDAMLVALGVGVGALISTEQGRHIIGSLAKTPVAQALGEGTVNLFKNMNNSETAANSAQDAAEPEPPRELGLGQPNTEEQGA